MLKTDLQFPPTNMARIRQLTEELDDNQSALHAFFKLAPDLDSTGQTSADETIMPQRIGKQGNDPIVDDWAEYKRLVLSELERLNQVADRLKEQDTSIQKYIQMEFNAIRDILSSNREIFNEKLGAIDRNHPNHEQFTTFRKEFDDFKSKFQEYKDGLEQDNTISNRWGFWTAVITIAGSLIVSIISLIVALL